MTALYTMKGKLELPSFDFSDAFFDSSSLLSKVMRDITRDKLAKAVPKYQSQLIAKKSETKGGHLFDDESLQDLVKYGNVEMRGAMILNSIASAYKGIDVVKDGVSVNNQDKIKNGFTIIEYSSL